MLALGLGCAIALWLMLSLPRRELRSPALALLRSLWPAWRFYEAIADAPALDHRVRADALGGEPGPWQRTLRPPLRTAAMLVWNPSGNLHLAYQSLVEHLASELAEREEGADGREAQRPLAAVSGPGQPTAACASYRLVQALVGVRIRADGPLAVSSHYQFRLVDDGGGAFESEWHALEMG
jgi:hypothetical protein